MRRVQIEPNFESWRAAARGLLNGRVPPAEVEWEEGPAAQLTASAAPPIAPELRIPRRFVELARQVARHGSSDRWRLLYELLWRVARENKNLLEIESDPAVRLALELEAEAKQMPFSGAARFIPAGRELAALAHAARGCSGCELSLHASQTVFGRGPRNARVVLVGEQPGDVEDRQGLPFVGPAGEVLDRALAEAGLDRSRLYVTNVVKHFKFVLDRGKRRIHQTPGAVEIAACQPWLEAEIEALRPVILVCLGATAARALLGSQFRILQQHDIWLKSRWAPHVMATFHPSAVLRAGDPEGSERTYRFLVEDLRRVRERLDSLPAPAQSREA